MRKIISFLFLVLTMNLCVVYAASSAELEAKIKELEQKNGHLSEELENIKLDRTNILKQAQVFQKEKSDVMGKMEAIEAVSKGATAEVDALKKEGQILNGEIEKMKSARAKDRDLCNEEKLALEAKISDEKARNNSLAKTIEQYSAENVPQMIEDRNRLQGENQKMAAKILEGEKQIEEIRRNMTPLELDREELHRIQEQNRQLVERTRYVKSLEKRQKEMIKENREYREELEGLKLKLKEAVPGLAKSTRISQKMMRENAQMHYNLGTIFLQNKRYKEAIAEYEKNLELTPNDPDTHYNLGVLYDDYLKDRQKALYHYQKYITVNPKAPDSKKVEGYILALELEQKMR